MAVDIKIYLITDRKVSSTPLPEAVRLALEGGVRAVQLREKDLPVRELLALAQDLRAVTRAFGARLFINDRVDVAVAVGADGVHLGTESIPVPAARKVAGQRMLIGVSTHSLEEAKAAEEAGADFITFGPIFETPSKAKYGAPVGLNAMKICLKEVDIPLFAIGGVHGGNIQQIITSGADGVAMISAIFSAPDIRAAASKFVQVEKIMEKYRCNDCAPR